MPFMYYGSPGAIRPSQLITSFGPGSIAQMTDDSVLVMGIDRWYQSEANYKNLNHPYLEELLGVEYFRMPLTETSSKTVTCRSFPTWGYCSDIRCCRLQRHQDKPPRNGRAFGCEDCGNPLYPAAFVLVCTEGHIDEFPWIEWAHKDADICDNPRLKFRSWGRRLGNSDYYVDCTTCGKSSSCANVTSPAGLRKIVDGCQGNRPWLNDTVTCNAQDVRGISVSAISLYYPSVVTALSIPEWSGMIQQTIGANMAKIRNQREMNTIFDIAERSPVFEEVRKTHPPARIAEEIKRRFASGKLGDSADKISEMEIRKKEYASLMSDDCNEKDLEIKGVSLTGDIASYVESLKQIRRITEIRAIRAFTRIIPPDPYSTSDTAAHYSRISRGRQKWCPATENRGEGLLFTIDESRLARWERCPDVEARCGAIIRAYRNWSAERKWNPRPLTARYLLLHTLSHALIRTVAYFSGYGEASIRERIYSQGSGGVMLYTANPSADGGLGGLVRQGLPSNFGQNLRSAIERSKYCSRDPLCADDDPIQKAKSGVPVHARLNGAACYGCALLPETSCENYNQLLDRRLLFDGTYGFFKDLNTSDR